MKKCLGVARPEGFEPPAFWFVASQLLDSTEVCDSLEPAHEYGN